jgi:ADP-heptose:LPS heptosyltransferase
VLVVSRSHRPQWHEVFENNPRIVRQATIDSQMLLNASGNRPYIAAKGVTRWTWQRWNIAPGEIYLSAAEKLFARPHSGHVLIEPNTKVPDGNKAWPWDRWQALVDRGGDFVQVGVAGTRRLRGVQFVETLTFRHACAVLSASRAFVGTEGGLGHAAAALGVPAVVLFSAFISPKVTGYPQHRNLYKGAIGLGCGARLPCACCRASMVAISVDEVDTNLKEILNG